MKDSRRRACIEQAMRLVEQGYDLYALLAAAMLKADSVDMAKLRRLYPELHLDLRRVLDERT